jgi:hypothetical protein
MTPERLAAIRARLDAVEYYPGASWPNAYDTERPLLADVYERRTGGSESPWTGGTRAAAHLIANAPTDLRVLLDALASSERDRIALRQRNAGQAAALQSSAEIIKALQQWVEALEAEIIELPNTRTLRNKMDEAAHRIHRQRIEECAPYLKEGETPAECIARNRADVDSTLALLAREKRIAEAAEQRVTTLEQELAAITNERDAARRVATDRYQHGWDDAMLANRATFARVMALGQQVISEMREKAADSRKYANVPCQSESSWHADMYEKWAHDLDAALTPDPAQELT